MVKGIQKGLLVFLLAGISLGAHAMSDTDKYKLINQLCGKIDGNINNYGTPTKFTNDKGEICWSIQCKAQTGEAGDDYNATVNTETRCYSEDELFGRISGDFDGGIDIDGLGTTIVINGETVTIGSPRWRELCVKEDGSIRGICGGGSGSASGSVNIPGGNGNGNGNGGVVISGGGGINIPKDCFNIWGNVKKECRIRYGVDKHGNPIGGGVTINGGSGGNGNGGQWEYHTVGNTTFRCVVGTDYYDCIGNDANIIISQSGDSRHCVDCATGGKRGGAYGTLSGIAEIAGSVLPPVMGYLGVKAGADAYLGANQAWAGAAATGFEQCQLMQTNYVQSYYTDVQAQRDYVMGNGLPDREFGGNMNMPGCNGYQLGGFAGGMGFMGNGMGGFGNPWLGAGYSPGMMGGMYGPYGMYNPYGAVNGMGGMYPGMGVGGMGGMYPGMGGGMYPGMGGGLGIGVGMGGMYPGMGGMGGMYPGMGGMGGMNPGLGINLGLGTMMPGNGPGMGMGMGMGGMYPGMGGMGGVTCIQAPCPGGGMGMGMGGMYPGMGGGINGGIGIGMNGGMYGNPWGGGAGGMGVTPWGNGAGSYWNGSGGWGAGAGGGAGWGNVQQSYMASNQAFMQDSYLQQAALQNSYQNSARNLWSNGYQGYGQGGYGMNYGYAPYSPGNMGLSLSAGWGFGF